ncbi:hypothetical protein GCM10022223_06180 [Kineosporia mesophila]|uniref:Uncharacterized protein n=1 Tax=Kineosporia mesophila TaxID=566012 RepID=A0ABP6YYT8_9ACTN|nr:hypothetical protein [Kineosporia mesophila]MCD5351001.1 hypothetical protein [Kineosporia mesophila]
MGKIQEAESFPGWQMVAAASAVVWSLLLGAPLWWMTFLLAWAGESNASTISGAVLTYLFMFALWLFPTWGLAACTSCPGLVWLLCALGTPGSAIGIAVLGG